MADLFELAIMRYVLGRNAPRPRVMRVVEKHTEPLEPERNPDEAPLRSKDGVDFTPDYIELERLKSEYRDVVEDVLDVDRETHRTAILARARQLQECLAIAWVTEYPDDDE